MASDECIDLIQLRTQTCINFIGNLPLFTCIIVSPKWCNHIGELARGKGLRNVPAGSPPEQEVTICINLDGEICMSKVQLHIMISLSCI